MDIIVGSYIVITSRSQRVNKLLSSLFFWCFFLAAYFKVYNILLQMKITTYKILNSCFNVTGIVQEDKFYRVGVSKGFYHDLYNGENNLTT